MARPRIRHTLITAALVALTAVRVGTTVIVPAEVDELAREASVIARGRVLAIEARWTDGHRRIESLVTLGAETYLKGGRGDTVQFVVPGGQLGRYRSIMMGAPAFHIGQRVIVFLGARPPAVAHVLGFNQGVFRLVPSEGGWLVTPPLLRGAADAAGPVVRGDPRRRPVPLTEFESYVRSLAGAER